MFCLLNAAYFITICIDKNIYIFKKLINKLYFIYITVDAKFILHALLQKRGAFAFFALNNINLKKKVRFKLYNSFFQNYLKLKNLYYI